MAAPRVAIVGGGLAGSLAALVAKSRGLRPTILDAGKRQAGGRVAGGRHADSGLQFLLGTDPRFSSILGMLSREDLVAPWRGRFGVLGTRGGGFLPAAILASTPIGSMMREDAKSAGGDEGSVDFCGLLSRDADAQQLYVGTPRNSSIIPGLIAAADIEIRLGAKVEGLHAQEDGGWRVELADGGPSARAEEELPRFDALVLATHDAALAASAVRSVAAAAKTPAEAAARLVELADLLQAQRDQRTAPVFSWSGYFPRGFSDGVPFDAATVPGSPILSFVARDASKPGRPALATTASGSDGGVQGELWTAVSTPDFAAALLAGAQGGGSGDSERGGGGAAAMAAEAMTGEVRRLLAPYFGGEAESVPPPLAAAAKRWGAGFATGTLGLSEECVSLEPWRLAICGDFIAKDRGSPAEAAALSGMSAAERVASWFAVADEEEPQPSGGARA